MPGLYGYVKTSPAEPSRLASMTRAMRFDERFIQDETYEDKWMAASRVHLGPGGAKQSPCRTGHVLFWMEGEAFNTREVQVLLGLKPLELADTLIQADRNGRLDDVLRILDGDFCAVLYNPEKLTVKLISDRYGMRTLYWYAKDGRFAWCSEVKGILALKDVDRSLDSTALPCFMKLGHLMGDRTWLEHIRLIPPATVMEVHLSTHAVDRHYYWKWSNIKPSRLSFNEAVDELGRRFTSAVSRRFNPAEKIGVSLSGGLDSRAILAAVHSLYPDYAGYAYTFGAPDCADIGIAKRVIARTNWRHAIFALDETNWLEPRLERIWSLDGLLDIKQMHDGALLDDVAQHIDINLHGYLGDAVLGGSYLPISGEINRRISRDNARAYYGDFFSADDLSDDFYNIEHLEPYLFMSRGRRFINMGVANGLSRFCQRKPFFDNEIIEFVFSLPDQYRLGNRLYSAMLQKTFPRFFKDIPWKKTGHPAGVLKSASGFDRAIHNIVGLVSGMTGKKSKREYAHCAEWIKQAGAETRIKALLSTPHPYIVKQLGDNLVDRFLIPHLLDRKDNSDTLLRLVTLQVYLFRLAAGGCD